MDENLFGDLVESMTEMGEITRSERAPSREFHVDALKVKSIRKKTGLSKANFAMLIDIPSRPLRN